VLIIVRGKTMITYLKLGRVRGISLEFKKELGVTPLFIKNTFHYETIIDIPYVQIIYTSGKWFPKRRVSNVNKENGKTGKNSKRIHKN
jgi:hypothetical protein